MFQSERFGRRREASSRLPRLGPRRREEKRLDGEFTASRFEERSASLMKSTVPEGRRALLSGKRNCV